MQIQTLKRALGQTLNRGNQAATVVWLATFLLVGGVAWGQAGQSSSQPRAAQQTSPASAPQNSSGPMVMGQDPDSTPDTVNAPATPSANPAQPATAKPGTLAPWTPANPPGGSGAAQPATAAAAPSEALPIPPPADAGADAARQQINNECVSLLKMANELKAAVDKSNKDTLSITVVRKANDIEALAHQVKDEMRPEVAKQ